jgi:hypothetical protein
MATSRLTHDQREQSVLADLEANFPRFTGETLTWEKVPDGQDPPDFIASQPKRKIGLELREWLDGDQMGPAKTRESQREQMHRILASDWASEYKPKNFRGASISPDWNQRISRQDEAPLRREFFACVADVDSTWLSNPDRHGNAYYQAEFSGYPLLGKYFNSIYYIGGEPHGLCWIREDGDGGAFDPALPAQTLEDALDKKLNLCSAPAAESRLKERGLTELYLLVHGGFNAYAYNTPSGHLSLEDICKRGAAFYAAHALRSTFNRVWFFDSLDSANEVNALMGLPPGSGRVRWLAQLWPEFKLYKPL